VGTTFHQLNTFTCINESDADTCVSYVHDALLGVGLVQTAAPGQLVGVSAWTPTVANTEFGFREYEMNDAVSGAHPLYVRVYFGVAGQGNTIAARSFVIQRVQVFFEKDGGGDPDPAKLLLYPGSFGSASGGNPVATPCRLHVYKRDGLLVFHGGVVTTANGGNRRLGTFIIRRTADGAFLLCDQTRTMATGNSFPSLGYSYMSHAGIGTPYLSPVNCPSDGVVEPLLASPRYFSPLILNTGSGVELLDDIVVTRNVAYEHYTYMGLVDSFDAPLAMYRILPSAVDNSSSVSAGTPFADSVPWVINTSSRYNLCLAYRL
jgi:hypothetical protein